MCYPSIGNKRSHKKGRPLRVFQFGKNRSAQVPLAFFGKEPLKGTLVVDRYNGYNKVPCSIQYCYAHLLREVEDLKKEFPDNTDVANFTAVVIPLLSSAIKLRKQSIDDLEFLAQAARIRSEIQAAIDQPAWHLGGILRIQDIFQNNKHRLYHWSEDRSVRADKNLAERDLRPSVIARKVSFGSVSDGGAQTRSTPTTVITTQRKRDLDTEQQLIIALDVYLILFLSPDQEKGSDLSLLQKKLHL